MDVNDNAYCLKESVVIEFIVGTPPGAGSLLQGYSVRLQTAIGAVIGGWCS